MNTDQIKNFTSPRQQQDSAYIRSRHKIAFFLVPEIKQRKVHTAEEKQ